MLQGMLQRFWLKCARIFACAAQRSGNYEGCDVGLLLQIHELAGTAEHSSKLGKTATQVLQQLHICYLLLKQQRHHAEAPAWQLHVIGQQVASSIQMPHRKFCMMVLQQEVTLQPVVQLW